MEFFKKEINNFLKDNLKIELHYEKSKVTLLYKGVPFLGFRNFYFHRVLKKNKMKLLKNKLKIIINEYKGDSDRQKLMQRIEGIFAYIEVANTFNLRMKIINKLSNVI